MSPRGVACVACKNPGIPEAAQPRLLSPLGGHRLVDMENLRKAAVSGVFYPEQPAVLRETVDTLLRESDARVARSPAQDLRLKALIVPHAGFVYSGPVAASAYQLLRDPELAARIRRVVLIGPAHRVYVSGLAASGCQQFETPLGRVRIDTESVKKLPFTAESPRAHAAEHSLEVQLPFLQRLLPNAELIPLLVSDAPPAVVGAALEALWGGPETLIVVSSDLSHFLTYREAKAVDADTAKKVLALRTDLIGEEACGAAAIAGLSTVAARHGLQPVLLDLRNSADTAGGRDRVVGYGSFAFFEPPGPNFGQKGAPDARA